MVARIWSVVKWLMCVAWAGDGVGLAGVIRRRYSSWVLWNRLHAAGRRERSEHRCRSHGPGGSDLTVTGALVALMVPVHGVVIASLLDMVVLGLAGRAGGIPICSPPSDVALRASWRTLREDIF